jgi:hypothetical protein
MTTPTKQEQQQGLQEREVAADKAISALLRAASRAERATSWWADRVREHVEDRLGALIDLDELLDDSEYGRALHRAGHILDATFTIRYAADAWHQG